VAILNAGTHPGERMQGVFFNLALHLLPGVITGLVFILVAGLSVPLNWPPSLALLVTWLVAGLPFQLGFMLHCLLNLVGSFGLLALILSQG
jgi:hypothetical protein